MLELADRFEGEFFIEGAAEGFKGDSRGVAPGEDPGDTLDGAGLPLAL